MLSEIRTRLDNISCHNNIIVYFSSEDYVEGYFFVCGVEWWFCLCHHSYVYHDIVIFTSQECSL